MKKIKNVVFVLLLFFAFNGCDKNPIEVQPVTSNEQFTVEQAQEWFGQEWSGTIHIKSGNIERGQVGIKPDWCNGFTSQNNDVDVVEVGLFMQGRFDLADEASFNDWVKTKNPKMNRSLTRMVFLKYRKDNHIDQFLMTVVGTKEYHDDQSEHLTDNSYLSRAKNFSGYILYHDLTGKFVNGWVYKKGELTNVVTESTNDSLAIHLKMAQTCFTTNVYTTYVQCTDWYKDTNGNGVYDEGVDPYTNTTCGDPFTLMESFKVCSVFTYDRERGIYEKTYVTTTGGTDGGYNPPEEQPCNCTDICPICGKCIDHNLKSATVVDPCDYCTGHPEIDATYLQKKYPCAYDVYSSFANFDNFISNTLKSTFGASLTFNVTFTGGTLSNSTDGECSGFSSGILNSDGTIAGGNFIITINDYILNNSTKEYIAVTYAHETLHALIDYYNAHDPAKGKELFPVFYEWPSYEDGDHLTMAKLYVNTMANIVRQINPNMPVLDAECLAWNGLQGTRVYDLQKFEFDQINGNGAWEAKMAEVNQPERDGTSTIGLKCTTTP